MRFLGQSASRVRRLCSGERGPIPQGTARVITPVRQTRVLVARVGRSVAICSACTPFCASLSAYRGTAVLLKLLYVFVAAAQVIPRLVGGLCCAASFNAHGAEWDGGTAIEGCAHDLASRWVARRYAAITASRAAGHQTQYWANAPHGEVVHDAASTVDPARLDR